MSAGKNCAGPCTAAAPPWAKPHLILGFNPLVIFLIVMPVASSGDWGTFVTVCRSILSICCPLPYTAIGVTLSHNVRSVVADPEMGGSRDVEFVVCERVQITINDNAAKIVVS